MVHLRRAICLHERRGRRDLGYLLAPDDRTRHVLDAGAPGASISVASWQGSPAAGSRCERRLPVRPTTAPRPCGSGDSARRLGAWVCIWGTFAMLTSAPFDDWWHNAYGLDVKIISPPHMVLAAGIAAIQCGAMLMALAWQNRAVGERKQLGRLYLVAAGLARAARRDRRDRIHPAVGHAPVALLSGVGGSVRIPARQHGARLDRPVAGDHHGARLLWRLTMIMLLVLPLFAAQPLLGPIYVQVDRFMPPDFPLLLVVPALAIDYVMQRSRPGRARDWGLAAADRVCSSSRCSSRPSGRLPIS